jgi:hypothetical protein
MPPPKSDRRTGDIPEEFDLDLRIGDPKIPGAGFQIMSLADCPDTQFCPGPGTGCFGATGIDTRSGATCVKICGETRGGTCVKFCIDTLRHKGCPKVFTRHAASTCFSTCFNTCVNTCASTCGAGCNATGTCICG